VTSWAGSEPILPPLFQKERMARQSALCKALEREESEHVNEGDG